MRAGFESRLRPPRRMPFLEPETALPVVIAVSVKGRHPPRQNTRAGGGQERLTYFQRLAPRLNDLPTIISGQQRNLLVETLLATSTPASLAPSARRSRLRLYEAGRLHHCPLVSLVTKGGYAVYPFPAIMNQ